MQGKIIDCCNMLSVKLPLWMLWKLKVSKHSNFSADWDQDIQTYHYHSMEVGIGS